MGWAFAAWVSLLVVAPGCGLVLDLSPGRDGDSGSGADGSVPEDAWAPPADGELPPPTDAGSEGMADSASAEDGAAPGVDGGRIEADGGKDSGPTSDGGGTSDGGVSSHLCSPYDCDGDGTPEDRSTDVGHCGACFNLCGLREMCCNGVCSGASTCSVDC